MKYAAIITEKKAVEPWEFADEPYQLMPRLGIGLNQTDTGTLWRGLSIIVYEFGLLEPDRRDFFAIGPRLFQGNALCYAWGDQGETIDVTNGEIATIRKHIQFLDGRSEVERAIKARTVERPATRVNGVVTWAWRP